MARNTAQAVATALTESRDELREAAATMAARFAGADERARRLDASHAIRDTVMQVGGGERACARVCARVCVCVHVCTRASAGCCAPQASRGACTAVNWINDPPKGAPAGGGTVLPAARCCR